MEDQSIYWNIEKLNDPNYDPDREYFNYVRQWRKPEQNQENINYFRKNVSHTGVGDQAMDFAQNTFKNPVARNVGLFLGGGGILSLPLMIGAAQAEQAFKKQTGKDFGQTIDADRSRDFYNRINSTPQLKEAWERFLFDKFMAEQRQAGMQQDPSYQMQSNPYMTRLYGGM